MQMPCMSHRPPVSDVVMILEHPTERALPLMLWLIYGSDSGPFQSNFLFWRCVCLPVFVCFRCVCFSSDGLPVGLNGGGDMCD